MKRLLEVVVEDIVRACDPDEILLFGSHAKGVSSRGSDIDLLVVGEFREAKFLRRRLVEEAMERSPLPLDVHVFTRAEMESAARFPFSFPGSIAANAISIYQRKGGLVFPRPRT